MYQPRITDESRTGGITTCRGNPKSTKRNNPQCNFVHYKSCMDCPGLETGPLWKEAGVDPPELFYVLRQILLN
jgi:hypothetical protein